MYIANNHFYLRKPRNTNKDIYKDWKSNIFCTLIFFTHF